MTGVELIVFAILVEAITEIVKSVVKDNKLNMSVVVSIVIGVGLAVACGINILAFLGFTSVVPFLGEVLTGLVLSRGANYLNDLLAKVNGENK